MIPNELIRFKEKGQPITILTAWDSISSAIVEEAGADAVLVGDSLAMVVLGHSTTLPVSLDEMLHHAKAVGRGFKKPIDKQPLVICDLPFLSFQCGEDQAVYSAGTLIKNSCAAAVKIEGAEKEILKVINRLIRMGIPVMGHLGLTPQSVHQLGYRRQAEDKRSKQLIFEQAIDLEKAGCFALVLEKVPATLAKKVAKSINIPVIGIGAGKDTDGQVLVLHDMLGMTHEFNPRFLRRYLNLYDDINGAVKDYIKDVKTNKFPNKKEQY